MLGLTLEGGGAKGAYQIGAWKAFREMGITFHGITGSSAGALNGSLMVQNDFEVAWDLWYHVTPSKVMDLKENTLELLAERKLDQHSLTVFMEELRKVIQNNGIDISPLYQRMRSLLNEDRIRKSPVDFGFVTVALTDRKPLELFKEDVPQGRLIDYLMASSYLPVFKDRTIDGKTFLDGAFYNNLPANMLVRKGFREIYAVRLLSAGRIIKVDPEDATVHYIIPQRDLGHILDFNQERSRRNLELGYLDTLRLLKGWLGKRYYLTGMPDERSSQIMVLSWHESAKKELCRILGLKGHKALNRLFSEEALPALFDLAGLSDQDGYQALLIRTIEAMAEIHGIDCLKVYSYRELLQAIDERPLPFRQQQQEVQPSFYRITEALFKPGREKKKEHIFQLLLNHPEWIYLPLLQHSHCPCQLFNLSG